ncbi:MAG: DUF697 domain-containing protein [Tissierellia bacterium]|jgi:hypothetical protein|nr:DUF697 domain-containing protein [Tissierellia bacterium]
MNTIAKTSRKLLLFSSIALGLLFFIFVLNQFVLLYDLLNRFSSSFALVAISSLGLILVYLLLKLILLWRKSSRLVIMPENPSEEEKEQYYLSMIEFLKGNKNIKTVNFDDESLSKAALVDLGFKELDSLSNPVIHTNASQIFLSTAISQNGSLDSIAVLITLIKMVWRLASIYQTRPTLKSMGQLYMQVASVVFMARTIEDSDLIENQIEPIITTILGESFASAIPGMVPITNLVVSSLMEGSLNALLTLRVGIIAQSYLGMEKPESKSFIQKNASLQAFGQMGRIIKTNGKLVAKSIMKATKNVASSTAKRWFNY